MTDNILSFPKNKIVRESPQNNEELEKLKAKGVQNFAEALVEEIADNTISAFSHYGLDVDDEKFIKDFHFLMCILGATVYRSLNLEHPFHQFIDDHIVFKEAVEEEIDTVQ